MKKTILVSIAILLATFYSANLAAQQKLTDTNHQITSPILEYRIIPVADNTWGYEILSNKKIFIHQPNMPGMPGKSGFKSKQDAMKIAQLVISKIKNGVMPPTVSLEEMKALKIQL